MMIESVAAGTTLSVLRSGRSLGLVEADAESALAYWGERQRKSQYRTYTLVNDRGVIHGYRFGHWREL
jgi:hypothetical protein